MGTEDTSPSSSAVLIKPNLPLLYSKYTAIQGYEMEQKMWCGQGTFKQADLLS